MRDANASWGSTRETVETLRGQKTEVPSGAATTSRDTQLSWGDQNPAVFGLGQVRLEEDQSTVVRQCNAKEWFQSQAVFDSQCTFWK